MRNFILIFIGIMWLNAYSHPSYPKELYAVINSQLKVPIEAECDSIVEHGGYRIHVIQKEGLIEHCGLNIFSDEMKSAVDVNLLNFIEEGLLAKVLDKYEGYYEKLIISRGSIRDFKYISPETSCKVNIANSKQLSAEWLIGDKTISLVLPLGYDTSSNGLRSEIENQLISRLRCCDKPRQVFQVNNPNDLEPYGENLLIYPGSTYQGKDISRNIYLNSVDLSPVWDVNSPLESIANLFLLPSLVYGEVLVDLTILKHEYGEKDILEVSVSQMLAACEEEGCIPYWGVERFNDGYLEGALFLYNQIKGYDHIIKIECEPEKVIASSGKIKARASLFVPTNNVYDLYSPYVKKTEKEKIIL